MATPTSYHGEVPCGASCLSNGKRGRACTNQAYYSTENGPRCGHLQNDRPTAGRSDVGAKGADYTKSMPREKLPKNPNAGAEEAAELERHKGWCERGASRRQCAGLCGKVRCAKMWMRKKAPRLPGFVSVFPNYRHGGRMDGFGCPSLSPMSLGPIEHGQPGVPAALNLENYYQGSKCFESELDEEGNPGELYYQRRDQLYRATAKPSPGGQGGEAPLAQYQDPVPHRHKPGVEKGDRCAFWVHILPDGTEQRLDYTRSRREYCIWYERLAVQQPEYAKLREMVEGGYNLLIVGYDGYDVNAPVEDWKCAAKGREQCIAACYRDLSRPFGHELCLYSMLVTNDPRKYPWRL